MKLFFDIILVLFAAFWLTTAIRGAMHDLDKTKSAKWIFVVPFIVGLLGASAFFAQALSAEGIIKLPKLYEWPAGYATNVITMPDGKHVVPIVPSGRVQVYNPDWKFVCGWNVDAHGGDFKIAGAAPETIEVFTARGQQHFTFNESGDLLSSGSLADSYYSIPSSGRSLTVRTPLLLWPFSNPFVAVLVLTVGFGTLALVKKLTKKNTTLDV
jgi:hypothetical protein